MPRTPKCRRISSFPDYYSFIPEEAEKEIDSIIDDAINYINQNPDFREFYREYQNFLNAKKEYERITT